MSEEKGLLDHVHRLGVRSTDSREGRTEFLRVRALTKVNSIDSEGAAAFRFSIILVWNGTHCSTNDADNQRARFGDGLFEARKLDASAC